MLAEHWQLVVTLTVVAAALFVLGRRIYRYLAGTRIGGCGTGACGSCGTETPGAAKVIERPLVQISNRPPSSDR